MNIEQLQKEYRRMAKNIMTSEVKDVVITKDNRIIELSTGTGIGGEKIWGVSEFVKFQGERLQTTRRGQMHRSANSARKHFNILLGAF